MKNLILLISFLSVVLSGIQSQITWEEPGIIPTPYSKYIRTCKIERGPATGDILMTYSDRQHGGNIWMMRSSDLGITWSNPEKILASPRIADGEYIFNANMIQLQDNRLMLCYQHRWDPGTVATKSYTGIRYSSDGGFTWSEEQKTPHVCVWEARPIQVNNDKNGDGHNDIYIYYTQEVNPTFFRPEHCNQQYSVGRAVAYIVSYDNGVTWQTNSNERFSGRIIHRNYNGQSNSQGGMPTMTELPDHRIAVVAEAPKGSNYAYASWVIASDSYDYDFDNIQDDWCSVNYRVDIQSATYDEDGYIIPSSATFLPDNLVYPNKSSNLWKMSSVYGNAPFVCTLPNGKIAYSQNSSQKIRVFVADVNGKNSVEVARPFSNSYNTFYSCIIPISDDMVLVTAHDYSDNGKIHYNRGKIVKDITPPSVPGTPRIKAVLENSCTFEWDKSTDDNVVLQYEIWINDNLFTTTLWDNFVDLDKSLIVDSEIKIRARDYQGNVSSFSMPFNPTSQLRKIPSLKLEAHPTIVTDKVFLDRTVDYATLYAYLVSATGSVSPVTIYADGSVDLTGFPSGVYQLVIEDADQKSFFKIIKK